MDVLSPPALEAPTIEAALLEPIHPPEQHQGAPPSLEIHEQGSQEDQVDISDHLTNAYTNPSPLPRPLPIDQASLRRPATIVYSRSKPFIYHKKALKQIGDKFNLGEHASDDSDTEAELETAIVKVEPGANGSNYPTGYPVPLSTLTPSPHPSVPRAGQAIPSASYE